MATAYVGRKLPEWVLVVGCYLDDSRGERREAIAGYLAPLGVWDHRFTPMWREFLASAPHKLTEYNASDARSKRGDFAPCSGWTEEEVRKYAVRAVRTLGDTSRVPELYGLGVATITPKTEHDADQKAWENEVYVSCFYILLFHVVAFLRRWRPSVTRLQVVHDEQPGLEGRLYTAFKRAKALVKDDCPFGISNLQFEKSEEVLPLQAADILSYETRKDLKSRLETPQRERSRALIHLLEHRTHVAFYLDSVALDESVREERKPPILYESEDAEDAFPWLEHSRKTVLDPPPLLPTSAGD